MANQLVAASLVYDLRKFIDLVSHSLLALAGLRLASPPVIRFLAIMGYGAPSLGVRAVSRLRPAPRAA